MNDILKKQWEEIRDTAIKGINECCEALINENNQLKKEKQERHNPQPLTLEQLKQRVGKPVFTMSKNSNIGVWQIFRGSDANYLYLLSVYEGMYNIKIELYGKTWLAYDYEPKESERN